MKKILILGAGLSTNSLIDYLLNNAAEYKWHITVADINEETARAKVNGHEHGSARIFDINDDTESWRTIAAADIVISMLPASMHHLVAVKCIDLRKPMLTASYATDEIKALDKEHAELQAAIKLES